MAGSVNVPEKRGGAPTRFSGTFTDVILQAAEGDVEAQRQFLKTSLREDSDWQEKIRYIFSIDPETMKSSFLDIFSGWYEQVFCELEQQVLPILQRDAAAKQALKQTMPLGRLIETATNGLEIFWFLQISYII